jgi:murein hydrolase activator
MIAERFRPRHSVISRLMTDKKNPPRFDMISTGGTKLFASNSTLLTVKVRFERGAALCDDRKASTLFFRDRRGDPAAARRARLPPCGSKDCPRSDPGGIRRLMGRSIPVIPSRRRPRFGLPFILALLVLFALPAGHSAWAQDGEAGTAPASGTPDEARLDDNGDDEAVAALAAQRERTAAELEQLAGEITLSNERLAELQEDVAALRSDEATLRETIIAAADAQRALTRDIADIEARFGTLRDEETTLLVSLSERRVLLAEVLAALQRMGRNPPPALLVNADDALASVRSAILLGSMVPEMREETEALLADLEQLSTIRASIESDRGDLVAALGAKAEEEQRLALLVEEKRRLQQDGQRRIEEERAAAERLAERATGLEDLIGSLEQEIASVREAAEEARAATQLRERQTEEQLERARELSRRGELDANRFAPAVAFGALRGVLRMPVDGEVSRRYGDDDGTGHRLQGITVASRSGALVQAPADGWVVYAGPFRSYGQLLILNAGDEYHVVMAGMDRINVSPGQFVVAGEPVATMGETRLAGAAALALASGQPTLYIEFRKDGQPVDPDPWWASEASGRASNDS